MGLLNYSLYCAASKKTILPWRIAECSLPSLTFKQFYNQHVVGCDYFDPLYVLKQVFVGHNKETLDLVDYDLNVVEVFSMFGRHVKSTSRSNKKKKIALRCMCVCMVYVYVWYCVCVCMYVCHFCAILWF